MVPEEREPDTDEGACREVEEADVPTELTVARVEVVALGEQHPPPRVEARVGDSGSTWHGTGRSRAGRRRALATRPG